MATLTKTDYAKVWSQACAAGEAAAAAAVPTPMVVVEADLFGRPLPDGKTWHVPSGVCGFAEVVIKPATSGFAKWLKAQGIARPHYYGGISVFVHPKCVSGPMVQSMEIKEAWARAAAKVLQDHGIPAHATSRMD